MKHPLRLMIERRRAGEKCGIPSYCTANELALEAALRRAKATDTPVPTKEPTKEPTKLPII